MSGEPVAPVAWTPVGGGEILPPTIANLSMYANNAAAIAGGLIVGQIYQTSTGQLMVVF